MPGPVTLRRSIHRVSWWLDRVTRRTIWRWSSARVLRGIRTAALADPGHVTICFRRIEDALELIERHDSTTLSRVRAHFDGILVMGAEPFRVAHWNQAARLCVITVKYLTAADTTSAHVALTLAHESMHARLCALGVKYEEGRRAVIEVLCGMAELALARRLPNEPELVMRRGARVTAWATEGESSWSEARHVNDSLAYMRQLGLPAWLVSVVGRVAGVVRRLAA